MRNFKKKIFALIFVLAFVFAGCFAAESYKNSLMALDLEQGTNGAVTITLQTKKPYNGNINLVKRDAITYIITLPEFNSSAPLPNLIGVSSISNIKIDTRPYSSNNSGYTKITIITNGQASIFTRSDVYVPQIMDKISDDKKTESRVDNNSSIDSASQSNLAINTRSSDKIKEKYTTPDNKKQLREISDDKVTRSALKSESQEDSLVDQQEDHNRTVSIPKNQESSDNSVSIWALIIFLGCVIAAICLLIVGKNKMAEIVGNSIDINFSDEEKELKKKSEQAIKQKKSIAGTSTPNTPTVTSMNVKKNTTEQVIVEKMNVIDMDELFNAQSNLEKQKDSKSSGNGALEDFLSNYYETQTLQTEQAETTGNKEQNIDEELYAKIMNNNSLKFSDKDMHKINVVINTEISEDIKQKVVDKTVTKPEKTQRNDAFRFEQIITDYVTKQNITFTSEDIEIMRKIMSVELDPDFTTDLRTNLKKHNAEKPMTKPAEIKVTQKPVVDSTQEVSGYNVSVLKIDAELPDLQDVLAHPEKYEESEQEVIMADENALLQTLSNVQFKPFYKDENDVTTSEMLDQNLEFNTNIENSEDTINDEIDHLEHENVPELSVDTNDIVNEEFVIPESVLVDDELCTIKSAVPFNSYAGCYLVQTNNGYVVMGYIRERVTKLKEYDTLKSEKISIRINETFENGNIRYLIKLGLKKFVADFDGSNITYVMDLC